MELSLLNSVIPSEIIDEQDLKSEDLVQTLTNNLYPVLQSIVKRYKPKTILEIGTRYGYSFCAMLDASDTIEYAVSIDMENEQDYGGTPGAYLKAQGNLKKLRESVRWSNLKTLEFVNCNTQKVDSLDFGFPKIDLAYVDGDHSFKGCFHDLNLVLPLMSEGGVILVDDIDWCQLRIPVDTWLADKGFKYDYFPDESGRGRYVIKLNEKL